VRSPTDIPSVWGRSALSPCNRTGPSSLTAARTLCAGGQTRELSQRPDGQGGRTVDKSRGISHLRAGARREGNRGRAGPRDRCPPQCRASAVIRGQIDAAVAGPGPIISHVKSGNAVALGVFDERRLPLAPDVPTFKELGFDVSLGSSQAIIAPRATPASVVRVLDDAIRKAVAEPSFVSLAERTQNTIDYKGPEAFAAELRRGFELNGELFRTRGIKRE
jgi:tripartite tricarboxylate transporter family receptor